MTTPLLRIALPRPVTSLHQIELTSHCNLRCGYCPSPHLGRPKLHMERATFEAALTWVRHFVKAGTQHELNLAGIGESTMHPEFAAWLPDAREAIGPNGKLVMATNGVSFTEEIAQAAAKSRLLVTVSLHRPEVANATVALAQRYGIFEGVSADPSINTNDWAGQVKLKFKPSPAELPCPWMRIGRVFCMADGRLSRCCLDADGSGCFDDVFRSPQQVYDNLVDQCYGGIPADKTLLRTGPWKLCKTCYQTIGIDGYDQYGEGATP